MISFEMGGSISVRNNSDVSIDIEVFSGQKSAMHHCPDKCVNVKTKEIQLIQTFHHWNIKIRFLASGKHFLVDIKNDATLEINNENLTDQYFPNLTVDVFDCLDNRDFESKFSMNTIVGVVSGTLGVIGGVMTPTLIVGGVQAIGFGAGGIVASSTAAGMMSTAAIASGGSVATGSIVATLQSIGAVGLATGPAGIAVVGGGLLVTGVAVGGFFAVKKIHESLKNPDKNCWDACYCKRPSNSAISDCQ